MGGMISNQVPVPDERMQQMITKLKLTSKDLQVLYGKFSRYDKESGTIDRSEFYASIDEKHTELGDAIFALIDEDNSGVLDFSEYVEALGKFCLLNKEDMLKFCFNVFDDDKNGTIEGEELTKLLEILHDDAQTSNMKHALKTFDFNGDGKIDFAEFKQLNTQFPSLLYPAFRIQQNMKIFTLGEKWWERKIEELVSEHHDKLQQAVMDNVEDMTDEALKAKKMELDRVAKIKRQEQAIRIRMGCMYYTCCPCRRKLYIVGEESSDSDSDSDEERARRKQKENNQKKSKKDGKKKNIVPIGPRKPLSQEERLERARKRRLRDMQDRPTRKD